MRHAVFGRQLSRTSNERKRLLEGLVRDVVLKGTITTTLAKAKAVQPMVEKLMTHARKNTGSSVQSVRKVVRDREVFARLMTASKSFGGKTSGFTRIVKIGPRKGDAAEIVRFGFVEMTQSAVPEETPGAEPAGKTRQKAKGKKEPVTKPARRRTKKAV